jgi:hypothetical protein
MYTYHLHDAVFSSGSSYVCVAATTTAAPGVSTDWQLLASKGDTGDQGPPGISGTYTTVTQTAHGFVVGEFVRHNGTQYVKSVADSADHSEIYGLVTATPTSGSFTVLSYGFTDALSGLTAGAVYYLSPTSSGSYTATEPSTVGQVSKPVLLASSTTGAFLVNMRGYLVVDNPQTIYSVTASGSGISVTNSSGNISIGNASWNRSDAAVSPTTAAQYYSPRFVVTGTDINWSSGNVAYKVLATGAQSLTATNPQDGARYLIILKQPDTGAAGTVSSWPTGFTWSGATAPTLTATNAKVDIITGVYDATNAKYYMGSNMNY